MVAEKPITESEGTLLFACHQVIDHREQCGLQWHDFDLETGYEWSSSPSTRRSWLDTS